MARPDPRSRAISDAPCHADPQPTRRTALGAAGRAALAAAVMLAGTALTATAAIDLSARVRVEVMARPATAAGSGQDFVVRDGGVLRSGDGIQLRIETDADAYVYVIALGSSNTALLLHPFSGDPGHARVRAGQGVVIPDAGIFLPLDDREGRETLFTIVSDKPLGGMSELMQRMETAGGDLRAATDLVKSAHPGARRVSFKHIGAKPLVGIAATTPRASPSAPGSVANGPAPARGASGESLLPPVEGSWSVSSTGGFGTTEAATVAAAGAGAAAATDPAREPSAPEAPEASTEPATAPPSSRASSEGTVAAVEEPSVPAADEAPVSDALRDARAAAGIPESQFRGILATLPGGDRATVPSEIRKPDKEQGVLSAEGTLIRAIEGSQPGSGDAWPADQGAGTNTQN